VKPGGGAGCLGDEEGDWSTEEGGLDGEDDLRGDEDLTHHDRKTAEHEGDKVRHALEAGGFLWHIEGRAEDDGEAGGAFGAVEGAAVVVADAPCGIVRWCCYNADVVATGAEPTCHIPGIFSDTREFRGIVQSVDQDSQ